MGKQVKGAGQLTALQPKALGSVVSQKLSAEENERLAKLANANRRRLKVRLD